jgi:cytochrome P450
VTIAATPTAPPRYSPEYAFDHHSLEYWTDPESYCDRARHAHRVAWSPHHGGFWVVLGAKEGNYVAQHPELFSSGRHGVEPGQFALSIPATTLTPEPILEEMDPPEHTQFRRLINVTLSPRESRRLKPRVEHWVTHFVDDLIEKGSCDLVNELTTPVPAVVTLDMLGVSTEDAHKYAEGFHGITGYPMGSDEWQHAAELLGWVDEQCKEAVKMRHEHSSEDAISKWMEAIVDDAPIADDKVAMLLWHLLAGGTETTGSLLASVFLYLHQNPEHRERLVQDPPFLELATEEFIRYFGPAKSHARTVMADTELSGIPMKAGDRVLLSWVSINRDEELFGEDSTELVLDRFPNRHASFSYGPHRCPGSHLARATFTSTLTQVLRRMPDYRILEDEVVRLPDYSLLGGYTTMPAVFTPGRRANGHEDYS